MKPIPYNGKRLFPQTQRFLKDLNPGDLFQIKHSPDVYTVQADGIVNQNGDIKYLPTQMPVIPLKAF